MRLILHICFLVSFWFISALGHTQGTSDEQLASYYYQNGDFDKATLYYEKLYGQSPSDFYYGFYVECLMQTEAFKDAEKLIKKHYKKADDNPQFYIDLGMVYKKQGDPEKAGAQFEKAIKELPANQSQIIKLANNFVQTGEPDLALETYIKGKKLLKGRYPFNVEIAEIYGSKGMYAEMIAEYLDLLDINENYLQSVQNALNRTMEFDKTSAQTNLLKQELLKSIQRSPGKTIYAEMLIWMLQQQKDFKGALLQVKAIDKREKEPGGRVLSMARICHKNMQYDLAVEAYEYILTKGENGMFYSTARMELLKVMNEKITTTGISDQLMLESLQEKYIQAIKELGKSPSTFELIRQLADLKALYLNKVDEAVEMLEEALKIPGLTSVQKAGCKIALADYLVIKNEIWDAALLYAQVEKEFKYDRIGEMAKFKESRIHYYTGDFKFAKAQLDVLKGSTSKMISNDAMELSLKITDNTGIDTTEIPLQMFARSELYLTQHLDSLALLCLDSIDLEYPGHALLDDILLARYKISLRKGNFTKAEGYLKTLMDRFSYDILADDAHFYLAELYQFQMKDLEKASEMYYKLITEYPGSLFAVEARKRYRILRGDNIN